MSSIDSYIPAAGLIVVITQITTVSYVGRGRNRRAVTNTITKTSFGSGFITDGLIENDVLKNNTSTTYPIVVSVAHLIPEQGDNRYFFKIFDNITKLSKLYELNLVSYNRSVDLCIFDFITPIVSPLCLQWNLSEIKSGEQCHVIGFPLGDAQLSIANGNVRDPTYCFSDLASGIDQIYHSVPVTNGNSGSCIVDKDGKIIGVHAWGLENENMKYENFCGGPSTKSAYPILSFMLNNKSLAINKYHPRVCLGVYTKIVNDIFRIINFNNESIKNIDGMIIESIASNSGNKIYSVDTHNKKTGTTKIAVNDIITHIFDVSRNEYVEIGYTKDAPVNILFPRNLTSSIRLKLRKPPLYDIENEITIDTPYSFPIALDTFYSTFI